MTKNKAQKRAARAHRDATGRSYTSAAREVTFGLDPATGVVSARTYATALVAEFHRTGWTADDNAGVDDMDGTPMVWCGPAQVMVGRVDPDDDQWLTGDPDDPEQFDLTTAPQVLAVTPPNGMRDDDGVIEGTFSTADLSPARVVSSIKELVAASRLAGLASKHVRARCSVCDEVFPEHHLLWVGKRDAYCPGCMFRPESGYTCVSPADLMEFYTYLEMGDSSYPTMWTALAVMTSQALRHSPRDALEITGTSLSDALGYRSPANYWMWLPQHPQSPSVLAQFGAGATIGAIVAALDAAHPDLRARYTSAIAPHLADFHYNVVEDGVDVDDPDDLVEAGLRPAVTWVNEWWESIVAFAVGFLMTPEAEGLLPDEGWADLLFTESFYEDYWMRFNVSSNGLSCVLGLAHLLVEMIAPGFPVTPGFSD